MSYNNQLIESDLQSYETALKDNVDSAIIKARIEALTETLSSTQKIAVKNRLKIAELKVARQRLKDKAKKTDTDYNNILAISKSITELYSVVAEQYQETDQAKSAFFNKKASVAKHRCALREKITALENACKNLTTAASNPERILQLTNELNECYVALADSYEQQHSPKKELLLNNAFSNLKRFSFILTEEKTKEKKFKDYTIKSYERLVNPTEHTNPLIDKTIRKYLLEIKRAFRGWFNPQRFLRATHNLQAQDQETLTKMLEKLEKKELMQLYKYMNTTEASYLLSNFKHYASEMNERTFNETGEDHRRQQATNMQEAIKNIHGRILAAIQLKYGPQPNPSLSSDEPFDKRIYRQVQKFIKKIIKIEQNKITQPASYMKHVIHG